MHCIVYPPEDHQSHPQLPPVAPRYQRTALAYITFRASYARTVGYGKNMYFISSFSMFCTSCTFPAMRAINSCINGEHIWYRDGMMQDEAQHLHMRICETQFNVQWRLDQEESRRAFADRHVLCNMLPVDDYRRLKDVIYATREMPALSDCLWQIEQEP